MKQEPAGANVKTAASEKETYRPPALVRRRTSEHPPQFVTLSMPPQSITPRGSQLPRQSMRLPRPKPWS